MQHLVSSRRSVPYLCFGLAGHAGKLRKFSRFSGSEFPIGIIAIKQADVALTSSSSLRQGSFAYKNNLDLFVNQTFGGGQGSRSCSLR